MCRYAATRIMRPPAAPVCTSHAALELKKRLILKVLVAEFVSLDDLQLGHGDIEVDGAVEFA